jgi:hypothetical protein
MCRGVVKDAVRLGSDAASERVIQLCGVIWLCEVLLAAQALYVLVMVSVLVPAFSRQFHTNIFSYEVAGSFPDGVMGIFH